MPTTVTITLTDDETFLVSNDQDEVPVADIDEAFGVAEAMLLEGREPEDEDDGEEQGLTTEEEGFQQGLQNEQDMVGLMSKGGQRAR